MVVTPRWGGFPPHSHDEYVISVNVNGWEKVRLDRASFEVGVDEVTVYNPGQVQSSVTETDGSPWSCVSLYVPVARMLALTGGEFVDFAEPVVVDPALRQRILGLPAAGDADLDSVVVDMLGLGLRRGDGPQPQDPRITQVLGRLREDLSSAADIAEVATEVGLSREQLIRAFTRRVGCSPYAWQLQARLAHGRRLLRDGVPIADVATAVGFADQAHFHKHFRAAYAITPGRFRRVNI
ncbi:AraC family transcriptional regulator [Actinoplanes sichuanensis]|uniref:AraC family transcriptional regulator n=1 Tax=Actinoplanes sichuanensis TaxID=512349 RepID=A0ABW4A1A3_9ACTN|nr:AraC family transcriptional regulator [Actinoplanes sichuanensis]